MTRHRCPGDDCPVCERAQDQAAEAAAGRPAYGYSQRDLDDIADARAADEFYGRGM